MQSTNFFQILPTVQSYLFFPLLSKVFSRIVYFTFMSLYSTWNILLSYTVLHELDSFGEYKAYHLEDFPQSGSSARFLVQRIRSWPFGEQVLCLSEYPTTTAEHLPSPNEATPLITWQHCKIACKISLLKVMLYSCVTFRYLGGNYCESTITFCHQAWIHQFYKIIAACLN